MLKYFLKKNNYLEPELAHFYSSKKNDIILSQCNKFYLHLNNKEYFFTINLKYEINLITIILLILLLFNIFKIKSNILFWFILFEFVALYINYF